LTKDLVVEEVKPAETTESHLLPLAILENRTVDADGKVYNSNDNIAIGTCIEGNIATIARREYPIDEKGNVWTRKGKLFGKCALLPSKKEGDPPYPPPESIRTCRRT
jgi:hypothetical protein